MDDLILFCLTGCFTFVIRLVLDMTNGLLNALSYEHYLLLSPTPFGFVPLWGSLVVLGIERPEKEPSKTKHDEGDNVSMALRPRKIHK